MYRKDFDYIEMYAMLDKAIASNLTQSKMYLIIGQAVCSREEKGAAVAAAEYLQAKYPDMRGFSPRNLRRMREFFHTYAQEKELLSLAMQISWTQNVTILEANLTAQERAWYLQQTIIHNWSKNTLLQNIKNELHKDALSVSSAADNANQSEATGDHQAEISEAETVPSVSKNSRGELSGTSGSAYFFQSLFPMCLPYRTPPLNIAQMTPLIRQPILHRLC